MGSSGSRAGLRELCPRFRGAWWPGLARLGLSWRGPRTGGVRGKKGGEAAGSGKGRGMLGLGEPVARGPGKGRGVP